MTELILFLLLREQKSIFPSPANVSSSLKWYSDYFPISFVVVVKWTVLEDSSSCPISLAHPPFLFIWVLSGLREMVTWSLGSRRNSILRNSFLCWSPLLWLMCDSCHLISEHLPLSLPVFQSREMQDDGCSWGSSLSCPADDLMWPSVIAPLSPPLIPWWCLPMSLLSLCCTLAQYTYKAILLL